MGWEFWTVEALMEMAKHKEPLPRSLKAAYGVACLILLVMIPFSL